MPRFVALTSRGLRELLADELGELGMRRVQSKGDGVEFESNWEGAYKVHLSSRFATRVILPILDFKAYNEEDLYHGVQKHNFTQYINVQQTFRIEAHVREHKNLRDQRFVALRVKDALVDQFRKEYGARPDVGSNEDCDLRIIVRVVGPDVSLAIDLTGQPLSFRGYRSRSGEAPLREHVAAALVKWSNWDFDRPLMDPFCGTGTIVIEAALMASGLSPNRKRKGFAFEKINKFQSDKMNTLRTPETRKAAPAKPIIFASDLKPDALKSANENASAAGIANWIRLQTLDVRAIEPPAASGIIVTNPPYGDRIGDAELVKTLMWDFSTVLKEKFKGWDLWLLSGNELVASSIGLKASRRHPVWNGPTECRFLHYEIR